MTDPLFERNTARVEGQVVVIVCPPGKLRAAAAAAAVAVANGTGYEFRTPHKVTNDGPRAAIVHLSNPPDVGRGALRSWRRHTLVDMAAAARDALAGRCRGVLAFEQIQGMLVTRIADDGVLREYTARCELCRETVGTTHAWEGMKHLDAQKQEAKLRKGRAKRAPVVDAHVAPVVDWQARAAEYAAHADALRDVLVDVCAHVPTPASKVWKATPATDALAKATEALARWTAARPSTTT